MNGGREAFGGIDRGRIIFPDDSGLILDLQAGEAPEGGSNGNRVTDFRRDYSDWQ